MIETFEEHEEAQALPWYANLRKEIDNIMDEDSRVSTRLMHREVCGVLHKTLPTHGSLRKQNGGKLVWADRTNNKPIAFERLLLTLGIIPSDPLYKVVQQYFDVALAEEATEDGI